MKTKFYLTLALSGLFLHGVAQLPSDGLVAYWPLNGDAGDESGNGYHGTVNGPVPVSDRFGRPNSAYRFDGKQTITTTFQGIGGNSERSISFWVKLEAADNGGTVCHYGGGFGTSFNPTILPSSAHIDISNSTVTYSSDANNDGQWHHFVYVFSTLYGTSLNGIRIYRDNVLLSEISASYHYSQYNINTALTEFQMGTTGFDIQFDLDELRVYDRVLSDLEIALIYEEEICSDIVAGDTAVYYVQNDDFEVLSPAFYLESTDSLATVKGGCDSIVHHYSRYVYLPTYCTDTLWVNDTLVTEVFDTTRVTVMDTIHVNVTDSISVTDTLVIDAVLTGIDPPGNVNTLKVYPNPTRDHVFIETGDFTKMNGYVLKIIDQLGAIVFETNVEQPLYEIALSTWAGYGMYYLQVIDSGGSIIDIRKIILE